MSAISAPCDPGKADRSCFCQQTGSETASEPRPKGAAQDLLASRRRPYRFKYNRRMPQSRRLTAIIEREGDVSLCPELDIASQGASLEEARANLIEAVTLFFETAD